MQTSIIINVYILVWLVAKHNVNNLCSDVNHSKTLFMPVTVLSNVNTKTRCTRGVRVVLSVTRMRSNNSARMNKSDFTDEKIV